MGDRDALIVICWLGILFMIFFECFYRKLKTRDATDVQSPRSNLSSSSFTSRGGGVQMSALRNYEMGGGNGGDSGQFTGPISVTCIKQVCIPYQIEEDDPPPSYEEAVRYATLVTEFQFSPYADQNIRESRQVATTTISTNNHQDHDNSEGGEREEEGVGGNELEIDQRNNNRNNDTCCTNNNSISVIISEPKCMETTPYQQSTTTTSGNDIKSPPQTSIYPSALAETQTVSV